MEQILEVLESVFAKRVTALEEANKWLLQIYGCSSVLSLPEHHRRTYVDNSTRIQECQLLKQNLKHYLAK